MSWQRRGEEKPGHDVSALSHSATGLVPPVSILKPVQGLDREGYQNFASMCDLDYPSYEIVAAASDASDPVIPQIQRLQQEFPKTNIRLIIGMEELGISPKTNNLCRLVNEAKYDLLAINDGAVRVEKYYLRDVVAPFADPKVGVILKASDEDA